MAILKYKDPTTQQWVDQLQPVDASPTSGSTRAVSSGGVYTALSGKVAVNQGVSEANKFLKVNNDGMVVTAESTPTGVQDVTVDGTSVVTAGVAAVDLSGKMSINGVSVSATGTATDEVQYITINGTEKKLAGGSGGSYTAGDGIDITNSVISVNRDTVPYKSAVTSLELNKLNKGDVSASATGTSANVANYITIEGSEYRLPSGGSAYVAGNGISIEAATNTISIDEQVTATAANLTAEVNRATAAEGVITGNLTAEVNRATAAEGVLTSSISDEARTARAAESALSNTKQDKLTAGTAINISNNVISATYSAGSNVQISTGNVISATDTTYTAGNGLELTDGEFSIDEQVTATKTDLTSKLDSGDISVSGSGTSTTEVSYITIEGTEYKIVGSSTAGVQDVKVDGESVVTAGVAEIDLATPLATKQNVLTAGSNITIGSDSTISATDTTYTAGSHINISNNTISTTYTAGNNIQINGEVISATDTTYAAGTNITIADGIISATDTTYTAGPNISITDNEISATDTTYTAGSGLTLTNTQFAVDTTTIATQTDLTTGLNAKVNTSQGVSHSGEVLTVNASGNVEPTALTAVTDVQIDSTSIVSQGVANFTKASIRNDDGCTATGTHSRALGSNTSASGNNQLVVGTWNVNDAEGANTFIVGNGSSNVTRSNAMVVTTTGDVAVKGNFIAECGDVYQPGGSDGYIQLGYTTVAPTDDNSGAIKVAILTTEPATRYSGWLYFIVES